MPISNFPNGFPNGVTIRGVPLTQLHPGKIFWVNGSSVLPDGGIGGSDGNKGTYLQPFGTIDGAIGKCKAGRGDIIMVMPGHTETVSALGGITLDVSGVGVVGIGHGALRPTITLDTAATASIEITAPNCTLSNVVISANFADITNAIDVTATNCALDRINFLEAAINMNVIDWISCTGADNTANYLTVTDCDSYSVDASTNSPLQITGDMHGLTMTDCRWNTDHANALAMIQCATGKDLTHCYVVGNYYASLKTTGDILIDNDTTANNGFVAHNRAQHLDTAAEVLVDCDGVGQFDNLGTGSVTASGYVLPAIDS